MRSKIKELFRKVSLFYDLKRLCYIIICLGVVLRLILYFFNRSLWLDESALALNIINRSFLDLLEPLDYNQGAPIGFLMIEKFLVNLFGNKEYTLRLFPLLSGIFSLFLFYKVAVDYIGGRALQLALLLFAISHRLIWFSSELKQYSSDVLVTLLILYLITKVSELKISNISQIVLLALTGAIAIWFSHPATFVLAGMGTSLVLSALRQRDWLKIVRLSIVYCIWLFSFAAFYFVSLGSVSQNGVLLSFWSRAFVPFPPTSFSDLQWFIDAFFNIFEETVGLGLPGIAALTFLYGCVSMFQQQKKKFLILISPVPFVLLASALHRYPFHQRMLLFLVPMVLIFIAAGVKEIRIKTMQAYSSTIWIIILVLLLFHPICYAGYRIINPYKEEIRDVLYHIRERWQEGDLIYVYNGAQPAFQYYAPKYSLKDGDYVMGVSSRENWGNYVDDLDKLAGNKRVWLLFSHVWAWHGVNEERFFLYYSNIIGKEIHSFKARGASAYLYDLR